MTNSDGSTFCESGPNTLRNLRQACRRRRKQVLYRGRWMPLAEVAALMGCSETTAKRRLVEGNAND